MISDYIYIIISVWTYNHIFQTIIEGKQTTLKQEVHHLLMPFRKITKNYDSTKRGAVEHTNLLMTIKHKTILKKEP